MPGAVQGQSSDSVADSPYGVVIRTANARLVQALAGFGDPQTMMADYKGLNGANDTAPAWLTVDAMPSIHKLASIG